MKKLVYGFGLNDADYAVQPIVNDKQVMCPFYRTWGSMLSRCYSSKYQALKPSYIGCTVSEDWIKFSEFKSWMEKQDWEGKQLDKDLLLNGNKIYSSVTCVFISRSLNIFTTDRGAARGKWPIGVSFYKRTDKFQASCKNPFTKKSECLGYYHCPNEAHQAWRKRKHELACQLADLQTDERVAEALRKRYL